MHALVCLSVDDLTLYRVRGVDDDGRVKYWTGEMRGRWPIYLKDPALAAQYGQVTAARMAAAFNTLELPYKWSAEPAL